MREKIDAIRRSNHPYSGEILETKLMLERFFNGLMVVVDILGAIISLTAFITLMEESERYSVDVPTNFFGYIIEMESDTFGAHPFTVFLYIILIFGFISFGLYCARTLILISLKTKMSKLDCLYRTEKYTELMIESNCHPNEDLIETTTAQK